MRKKTMLILNAVVKMKTPFAAHTWPNTVNHPPTTCVVNQDMSIATENASQKTSHVAMLQLSIAPLNMINVLNTAAAVTMKNAVKRERNVSHMELSAVTGTNMTAMANVFMKMNTVAHMEPHGANTLTNAKNTAVTNTMDSSGANTLKNVIPTVAHTTLSSAHTLESALMTKNTAAQMTSHTANTLTNVHPTAVNIATISTKFTAQSPSNAKTSVTAVTTDTKPAIVSVDPTMLILHATPTTERNVVTTTGAKLLTSVLLMKLLAVLRMDTPTLDTLDTNTTLNSAAQLEATTSHTESQEKTTLSDAATKIPNTPTVADHLPQLRRKLCLTLKLENVPQLNYQTALVKDVATSTAVMN